MAGRGPEQIDVKLSPDDFEKLARGRKHVPVGKQLRTKYAGLPWDSVADVQGSGERVDRVVGPAEIKKRKWILPVLWFSEKADEKRSIYEREARKFRRSSGLEARKAG